MLNSYVLLSFSLSQLATGAHYMVHGPVYPHVFPENGFLMEGILSDHVVPVIVIFRFDLVEYISRNHTGIQAVRPDLWAVCRPDCRPV
jgi:hypothetical protein